MITAGDNDSTLTKDSLVSSLQSGITQQTISANVNIGLRFKCNLEVSKDMHGQVLKIR